MRCRESVTDLLLLEPELANQSAGALHFIGHQLGHLRRRGGFDRRAVLGEPLDQRTACEVGRKASAL